MQNSEYWHMLRGCDIFQDFIHINAPQLIFKRVLRACLVYTGMLPLLLSSTIMNLLIFVGKSASDEWTTFGF